jgi:hypothetical protein
VLLWACRATLMVMARACGDVRHLADALFACWIMFIIAALLEVSMLRLWVVTYLALLLALTIALKRIVMSTWGTPTPGYAAMGAAD